MIYRCMRCNVFGDINYLSSGYKVHNVCCSSVMWYIVILFQCHKVVVSACSPVLQAMMTTDMAEATKQEVTLHNIPSGVMELLMEYMYKGEANIPPALLLPVTEACDYLQLVELRERCLRQASSAINPNNAISWHKLADVLNIDKLKTKCLELLSSSLADVSEGPEFLEMSFAEVSNCISGAQETGADSDDLLEATTNWVAHKQKTRQDHILDMLEKLDLTRCSVECLGTEMDKHKELLCAQPAALGKLTKSLIQISAQASRNIRNKKNERGRKDANIIVISGQEANNTPCNDCWLLDKSMNFVDLCKLAFSFRWHSVCQIPGGFVVTGGEWNNLCAMFVLSTKSCKHLERLPAPRDRHGSIFMKGKIYLFGGNVSNAKSSSVISLDLDGGKWNKEPDIPTAVNLLEVACMDSSIFLFDGYYSKQLLQLDMMTKTWSTKAKPPQQDYRGADMISVNGQLLISGGNYMAFAQYNPSTDTWTTGNVLTLQHFFGSLVHHDKKVYLTGGNNDHVEEYDLDTKAWSVRDVKLPKKVFNLYAFTI